MQLGSATFEAYNKTLRRIMWADFVDEQLRIAREKQYRASLVEQPYEGHASLVALMAVIRQANEPTR